MRRQPREVEKVMTPQRCRWRRQIPGRVLHYARHEKSNQFRVSLRRLCRRQRRGYLI